MKINLQSVAELQPGVYLKPENEVQHKAYLLGIKDFDDGLNLIESGIAVEKERVKEKYIIQKDHVLFSSRLVFNAFRLPKSKKTYVASNSFILIKPDTKKLHPGYLRWFLNHPNIQKRLVQFTQGSSRVPYISQKKLGNLLIVLPELEVQKDLAKMNELLNREKSVRQKLIVKREEYLQALLLNRITNE